MYHSLFFKQWTKFFNLFQAVDKEKTEKFENIKQIAHNHINQPEGSSNRFHEQCVNILTPLINHHGYYCYQQFTKNLDQLEEVEQTFSSVMNR